MKKNSLLYVVICMLIAQATVAQENVFLDRNYWKAQPTLAQVKKDIAAGNDATQLNSNAFDAVTWALIEKVDNEVVKYLLSLEGNGVNKRTHDSRTYIFWAGYKANLEMMQLIVDKGAKLDVLDSHGYTPMNFAASTGQQDTKVYDFYIQHGADPNTEKDHNGANALLLLAPSMEDDRLINYFVSIGVDIHTKDDKGNGIFNYAAKRGNIQLLNDLIAKGVDYKSLNTEGGNAFLFASQGTRSRANPLSTYQYLEGLGLQPNVVTENGRNPLHSLAYRNTDPKIFDYFIQKGVDVNQADQAGNTPFMNAAYRNQLESVRYLQAHVKDLNSANKKGQTALMLATQRNSPEVVEFLLDKGASTAVTDTEGNSLAYYLIQGYSTRNIKAFDSKLELLKQAGLSFQSVQAQGHSLWHLAVQKNDLQLVQRIAAFDIPVNTKNKEGLTPLHLAAMKATDTRILKFLLEQGADKTATTDFDETVYDLAAENELLQAQYVELNFLK